MCFVTFRQLSFSLSANIPELATDFDKSNYIDMECITSMHFDKLIEKKKDVILD